MDLVWGYAGILSLGHGLFFALGGYGMGMYLMRSIAGEGVYRSNLPDFMVFLDWKELPWYWHGFQSFRFAAAMSLVAPGAAGARVRLVRVPLAHPRRLPLDRHAGAHLRGDAALLPERRRLRRQQRPDRLQAHPRLAAARSRARAAALYVASALALLGTYLALPVRGDEPSRPRADRRARRRAQDPLLRLRVDPLQAVRLDAVRDAVRARRRALRPAGRDHQPERDAAVELDRDGDLGGGRRARHARSARCSAPGSSTAARAGSRTRSPRPGCTRSARCSSW